MIILLSLFKVLLPLLHGTVFATYLWVFLGDDPWPRRWCTRLAAITVMIHTSALVTRSLSLGRLPMGSPLEFASLLSAAMLLTYLILEKRRRVKQTGFLVTGLAFLLQFIASSFGSISIPSSPLLEDPGFAGHAVLALVSYTALSLGFIYAVLYLIQARQLARKQFGHWFRRLPSLDVLERMSIGAVELGVGLLFVSLCLGHLTMYALRDKVGPELAATLSPLDPKILVSWVILLGYVVGLVGHRLGGWRGRRMSLMSIVFYVVIIIAMGSVHHFVPSFHIFRSSDQARITTSDQVATTMQQGQE